MINLKKHAALREALMHARVALRRISLMWPDMDTTIWQRYSHLLTLARREAEEKRLSSIAAKHTMELPALPKPVRARLLLFGEEVDAAMAEDTQERHTDPLATRKLHKAHFIETEQRATVKKQEVR